MPTSYSHGMAPKIVGLFVAALVLGTVMAGPPASAAPPQIEDPANDYPVPFLDLTAVSLAVAQVKGGPALQVTYTLSGVVSPESRYSNSGYSFVSKVGKCDLLIRVIPGRLAGDPGYVTGRCGLTGGRDVGGTFKISDKTITALVSLRDFKEVGLGKTMTDLRAFTIPGEYAVHDTAEEFSAAGDNASTDKPWTIG